MMGEGEGKRVQKFKDAIFRSCVWLLDVIFEPVYFFRI